jgi:myotubularin-related protein 1/2
MEESENAISVIMHFVYSSSFHHLFCFEHRLPPGLDIGWSLYDIEAEFRRQGVLLDWNVKSKKSAERAIAAPWRLSKVNEGFRVCQSYPELLCVPAELDDAAIASVAGFRSEGRLPTLSWGYAKSAGSIWRSSQPKVGMQGKQCREDEALLAMAAAAGARQHNGDPVIHIVDCRPVASARANALTGHGTENSANYTAARVSFCSLENIHSIREAYQRVERLALSDKAAASSNPRLDVAWGQLVEDTRWLHHQRLLLAASHQVASLVSEREEPVLVHCRY